MYNSESLFSRTFWHWQHASHWLCNVVLKRCCACTTFILSYDDDADDDDDDVQIKTELCDQWQRCIWITRFKVHGTWKIWSTSKGWWLEWFSILSGVQLFSLVVRYKNSLINSNPSICHDICDSKEVAQYLCLWCLYDIQMIFKLT